MNRLEEKRIEIDAIDNEMAKLFERRMTASREVAEYKREHALPILDAEREAAVIAAGAKRIEDTELREYYTCFMKDVMKTSRAYQSRLMDGMKVVYSGAECAFGYIAAKRAFPGAVLEAGADFAETAKKYSQDLMSARRGGELPELGPGSTLKEFEDKCYALKAGEMSKPFESTAGYHIVLMRSRGKLAPYEQKKDELIKALNRQGLQQVVFNHAIDKMVKTSGGLSRDEVLDKLEKEHEVDDTAMKNTVKDYREGLLAYNITKQEVWDKAEKDRAGMEAFFKKNKKNYNWDSPRYKGFVFHTSEEALVKPVKAVLKKCSGKGWFDVIKKQFNNNGKDKVVASYGVWKQGENRYVDKYVFKDDNVKIKEHKSYPYLGMQGKLLKKGPEELADVKAQVVSDYQDFKEKEWMKKLRSEAKVEVRDDIVTTVSNH